MNGCNITAGQQDYAERLNQIESQKEDYYRELGIAPGVPTMKGSYGDPENTGVGYNTIIRNLGDHSVPAEWAEYVKKNEQKETAPGAPIAWEKPSQPEEVQPGYGFIPENESTEETFYYHSDHLGSTSYITDDSARITQYTAYLPYGELLVDEHSSSEDMPYKFNGKELDEETGLYYYGARYMQPITSIWYGIDPLTEKYPDVSGYVYCMGNPVKLVDVDGNEVYFVHGTWSNNKTWKNLKGLLEATNNLFGDPKGEKYVEWSGGNYASMRTVAANDLKKYLLAKVKSNNKSEPITLVGHSHGGNVCIEAINMMIKDERFKDVEINLLTINTPVRDDYQLSKEAQKSVNHVNVYDPSDPVQINGGHSDIIAESFPSIIKGTGEYGKAERTFKNARNIKVKNPQPLFKQRVINKFGHKKTILEYNKDQFHNSHNRVYDWIDYTKSNK